MVAAIACIYAPFGLALMLLRLTGLLVYFVVATTVLPQRTGCWCSACLLLPLLGWRIDVTSGREHLLDVIRQRRFAILCCNHVSDFDTLVISKLLSSAGCPGDFNLLASSLAAGEG